MADSNNNAMVEVIIGDIIDPATFRMVLKSDMDDICAMEQAITKLPGRKLELHELRIGRLVAVESLKDQLWFRASVNYVYPIVEGQVVLDALLIDHGITLQGIKYPMQVRKLPDIFLGKEPYAFNFSLDGLIPMTRTFKFHSSKRQSFPMERAKKWADITSTVAHIAVLTNRRASICIESCASNGKPKSGRLMLELNPDKLELYMPYQKFLIKGGFCPQLPVLDLHEAYVKSKFAIFVEPDYQPRNEIKPIFSRGYKEFPSSISSPPEPEKIDEDKLSADVRKMKLCSALDELM